MKEPKVVRRAEEEIRGPPPRNKTTIGIRDKEEPWSAYAFTDYQSQAQTLSHSIIDIAPHQRDHYRFFHPYVALSCWQDRDYI
jgi:hypothetical protein